MPAWLTVTICPCTLIVPVRSAPGFACTVKLTAPAPVPVALPVIVIHVASVVAVHAHPGPLVVTLNDAGPPVAASGIAPGATVYVQPLAWFTVNVSPAIVTVPERAISVVPAIESRTGPEPAPVAPLTTVIHGAFGTVDQLQLASAATLTAVSPPAAGMAWLVGSIEYVQPDC